MLDALLLRGEGVEQVVFVHHQDAGLFGFQDELGDLAILHLGSACAIDDEEAEVGAADALQGLLDAEDLNLRINAIAAANAGGVDELVVATVVSAIDVHGIARGPGDLADDGALLLEDGVDEGGFTSVGTADDGDFHRPIRRFGGAMYGVLGRESQALGNDIDEVVDSQAMDGADFGEVAEAQLGELGGAHATVLGVGLVADEDDGLLGAAEDEGELVVHGIDALDDIDHKDEEIGDFERNGSFDLNLFGEDVLGFGSDAAGVHEFEEFGATAALGGDAVAGDARHVVDDGDVLAGEAIEEGRFPDVGATDNGDSFHKVRGRREEVGTER